MRNGMGKVVRELVLEIGPRTALLINKNKCFIVIEDYVQAIVTVNVIGGFRRTVS